MHFQTLFQKYIELAYKLCLVRVHFVIVIPIRTRGENAIRLQIHVDNSIIVLPGVRLYKLVVCAALGTLIEVVRLEAREAISLEEGFDLCLVRLTLMLCDWELNWYFARRVWAGGLHLLL